MKKNIFKIFALLMVLAMVVAPASAKMIETAPGFDGPDPRTPREVPQEIRDLFEDGMSIDEFLLLNKGPIPNALREFSNKPMVVIVQMEQPALVDLMVARGQDAKSMQAVDQKSYVNSLKQAQAAVVSEVKGFGGVVLGQYTKTYNGLLVQVTADQLQSIRKLEGVKDIRRAPVHKPALTNSIPLINADDVWADPGYTGEGVTIAVIDTGIDYTHAMFGGEGTVAAYENNDPDVIEPGSFPTMKVIGGYDFAGTDYDASTDGKDVPIPDADPLDEGGHGTHVASTAAGIDFDDTDALGSGVAPDAKLYALKVFGAEGSTNLVLGAIEWAMDPNGDGDISDHVDVINMSLGSGFGPNDPTDPEIIAVENAAAIGVFLAVSAGNAGDSSYIVGSPSVSDSALSVAASSTGFAAFPMITYNDGTDQQIPYQTSDNAFESAVTGLLADVDALDEDAGTGFLCSTDGFDTADFTGKIALVQRGSCNFSVKINNADALGSIGIIVYNNEDGGDAYVSMATEDATLPAAFITHTDGLTLAALDDAIQVTVGPDADVVIISYGDPDVIADFSSRGPRGYDSVLKPEISAPGVSIFAAKMGGGDTGVSMSGTSMAAPHIAGVAALMKEAHPLWTVEQIKAAMMNTADDLYWGLDDEDNPNPPDIPLQGAGRVDALRSVTTDVIAVGDEKLVSLNWGLIETSADEFVDVKTITLQNFGIENKTYNISETTFMNGEVIVGTLRPLIMVTDALEPKVSHEVVVPAGGTATVTMQLTLDMTAVPLVFGSHEEYYGFVTFEETTVAPPDGAALDTMSTDIRVPFYFSPRPYTELNEYYSETSFDAFSEYGVIALSQSGPQPSNLWAYPVTLVDPNETNQLDAGDLRYVGLDYSFTSGTYGTIVGAAFAMYGPVHTNQPYFSEVDMYIDADQDGSPETVNFNYNTGWLGGGDDNNDWFVIQVDFTDGEVYPGSPYYIWADFNSGVQEWYLPANWNYLDIDDNPTFDYEVYSYDFNGMEDYAGSGRFDISKLPLMWGLVEVVGDAYEPFEQDVALQVAVDDLGGYIYSQPKGIMLFDYNGRPGMGQAQYWSLDVTGIPTIYFPLIFK